MTEMAEFARRVVDAVEVPVFADGDNGHPMIAALLMSGMLLMQVEPVHEVGSRKQLFVDHRFIESAEGVTLRMHAPVRTAEVLVTADAPWERGLTISSYSSILRENGNLRRAAGRSRSI